MAAVAMQGTRPVGIRPGGTPPILQAMVVMASRRATEAPEGIRVILRRLAVTRQVALGTAATRTRPRLRVGVAATPAARVMAVPGLAAMALPVVMQRMVAEMPPAAMAGPEMAVVVPAGIALAGTPVVVIPVPRVATVLAVVLLVVRLAIARRLPQVIRPAVMVAPEIAALVVPLPALRGRAVPRTPVPRRAATRRAVTLVRAGMRAAGPGLPATVLLAGPRPAAMQVEELAVPAVTVPGLVVTRRVGIPARATATRLVAIRRAVPQVVATPPAEPGVPLATSHKLAGTAPLAVLAVLLGPVVLAVLVVPSPVGPGVLVATVVVALALATIRA
jgi:hypothetical protein